MQFFLENSAPYWIVGAIGLTMAAILYSSLRSGASLLAILGVLLLTTAGLLLEHFYETPREQVQSTLRQFLAAVEADDMPAVLMYLSPNAQAIRNDAQRLMPEFEVTRARATGAIEVEFVGRDRTMAQAEARVFVSASHRRGGMRGGDFARVEFQFVRQKGRWRLESYTASEDWRRGAAQLRKSR